MRRWVRRPSIASAVLALRSHAARKLADEELAARKYSCTICGDSFALDGMYVLDDCSHRYCRECLNGYLLSKINDGRTRDIRCPEPKCGHMVSYSEVRHLVDAPTFEKFERFLLQATLNDDPNTKWCPRPGCGNAVIAHARGGGSAHHVALSCMVHVYSRSYRHASVQ